MNRTLIIDISMALSAPVMAAHWELANDPATGGPARFAAEAVRREAETNRVLPGALWLVVSIEESEGWVGYCA